MGTKGGGAPFFVRDLTRTSSLDRVNSTAYAAPGGCRFSVAALPNLFGFHIVRVGKGFSDDCSIESNLSPLVDSGSL